MVFRVSDLAYSGLVTSCPAEMTELSLSSLRQDIQCRNWSKHNNIQISLITGLLLPESSENLHSICTLAPGFTCQRGSGKPKLNHIYCPIVLRASIIVSASLCRHYIGFQASDLFCGSFVTL